MKYTADFSETLKLADGRELLLRLIRPEDKEILRDGVRNLSPRSQYLRFFQAKDSFSSSELAYLTELDTQKHVAILAIVIEPDGSRRGIGVARFIRRDDEPDIAEVAVVVTDEFQHQGIGTRLLENLVEAALERDIHWFECHFLDENQAIHDLIEHYSEQTLFEFRDDAVVDAMVPLHQPEHADQGIKTDIQRLLLHAASGVLTFKGRGIDEKT